MNRTKVLETVLVLVLALGLLYWFNQNKYLLLAAGVLAATGLFIPPLAAAIHWAWMKLAEMMGFVMNKVILTIVFVILVIPLSFISRLFRKNIVKIKPGGSSYFKNRDYTYTKDSLENVW